MRVSVRALRELFLERVIRTEAVQRERAAAFEEVRRAAAPDEVSRQRTVTEQDLEFFFDHGILPGGSPWLVSTSPIRPSDVTSPLQRALIAAIEEWHRLVRDLRRGTWIVTGAKPRVVMTIEPTEWLGTGLKYDVRANAICCSRPAIGAFGATTSQVVTLWKDITVREAADLSEPRPVEESDPGNAVPSAPGPAETSDDSDDSPSAAEYRAIRAVLSKKFPSQGPTYRGIRSNVLEKAITKDVWNAEVKARKLEHLCDKLLYKITRAIGRRRAH